MQVHAIRPLWSAALCVWASACLPSDFGPLDRAERTRESSRRETVSVERPDASVSTSAVGQVSEAELDAGPSAERDASLAPVGVGAAAGASGSGVSVSDPSGLAGASGAPSPLPAGAGGQLGAAGASGSASAAGQAAPAGCGDTTSDPAHCGACDKSCSAPAAAVSCMASSCVRSCELGFADCNGDLASGSNGDGCETNIRASVISCGGCAFSCETATNCQERRCGFGQLTVGAASAVSELHGSPTGGDPYQQLCGENRVLVGLEVAASDAFMFGMAAVCAPLELTGSTVSTGARQVLPAIGNLLTEPAPVTHVECPAGAVVTAVSGGSWYYGDNQTVLCIRQLTLRCSQLTAGASAQLQLSPSDTLRVGPELDFEQAFSDQCPADQVVVGFVGKAGGFIDSAQTQCAPLTLTVQGPPWFGGPQP